MLSFLNKEEGTIGLIGAIQFILKATQLREEMTSNSSHTTTKKSDDDKTRLLMKSLHEIQRT